MNYRLVFNGSIYEKETNALRSRIVQILEQPSVESLTVIFSSEGGSTDQGLSLYNFFQLLPLPITMHAVGHVGSAAIPAFLGGHMRTCSPFSRFFVHAYDWAFEGRQLLNKIEEALQRLKSDIDLAGKIAAKHTKLGAEQLSTMYSVNPKPTIFTPEQAKQAGIIQEILSLNPDGIVQPNVSVWTVGW